ncbi:MAG TPA: zinc ribbon domain-containing protein [Thermoplasmata archaeon]|nr:zinc ribbon domain-containing protein [Thermoplasmata archaeon]
MTLDTISIALVFLATVAAVAAAFFYLAMRRLRHRRATLRGELAISPDTLSDRAHNALSMARAEAKVLARDGYDVGRQVEQLDEAQGMVDRRDLVAAESVARSVHNKFVEMRRTPSGRMPGGTATASPRPLPLITVAPTGGGGFRAAELAAVTEPAGDDDVPEMPAVTTRLPKNRVESQFQLELLDEELGRAAGAPGAAEAVAMRDRARAASARADYTEALRLALKARRQVGGKVESLHVATPVVAWTDSLSAAVGPALRCPSCDRPMLETDRFCRACGRPRGGVNCPRCSAPLEAADAFCGRCGAPLH